MPSGDIDRVRDRLLLAARELSKQPGFGGLRRLLVERHPQHQDWYQQTEQTERRVDREPGTEQADARGRCRVHAVQPGVLENHWYETLAAHDRQRFFHWPGYRLGGDLLHAAALIAALPTLFVYVVAGKYFVRGLTAGAVKG